MLARILIGVVRLYQLAVSPWMPGACRFTPTCSTYAVDAIEGHGPLRGSWLAAKRLARCHPWGGYGYDPVPLTGAGGSDRRGAGGHRSDEDDHADRMDGTPRTDRVMAG